MTNPGDTPARQRAHALMFNAITRGLAGLDVFMSLSQRELLARAVLDDLARWDAAVYAHPDPDTLPSQTLAGVAERLHTLGGPNAGASRNVEVRRAELHDMATAVTRHAQPARPFHGDLLAYDELPQAALGWRVVLAILAQTGTTAEIPAEYLPNPTSLEIISGWTLGARTTTGTTPGTVALSATKHADPTRGLLPERDNQ